MTENDHSTESSSTEVNSEHEAFNLAIFIGLTLCCQ